MQGRSGAKSRPAARTAAAKPCADIVFAVVDANDSSSGAGIVCHAIAIAARNRIEPDTRVAPARQHEPEKSMSPLTESWRRCQKAFLAQSQHGPEFCALLTPLRRRARRRSGAPGPIEKRRTAFASPAVCRDRPRPDPWHAKSSRHAPRTEAGGRLPFLRNRSRSNRAPAFHRAPRKPARGERQSRCRSLASTPLLRRAKPRSPACPN